MFKLFDEERWLPVPPPLTAPGGRCLCHVCPGGSGQLCPSWGQFLPSFLREEVLRGLGGLSFPLASRRALERRRRAATRCWRWHSSAASPAALWGRGYGHALTLLRQKGKLARAGWTCCDERGWGAEQEETKRKSIFWRR